jgi:superoxide dismutase, Fe-Mn family
MHAGSSPLVSPAPLVSPERRRFMIRAAAAGVAVAAPSFAIPDIAFAQEVPAAFPALPWAENALEPIISARTVGFHYGKHHRAYFDNMVKMLDGPAADMKGLPFIEVLKASAVNPNRAGLFNNAAQVWNHSFFWSSLAPGAGGEPKGKIGELIVKSFGDYGKFKEQFAAAAMGQFGSGWAWLCLEGEKLTVRRTGNADTPVYVQGVRPLLTIDVWEHAYYLDYQNRRADFVAAVIDKLLNWEFAEKNLV